MVKNLNLEHCLIFQICLVTNDQRLQFFFTMVDDLVKNVTTRSNFIQNISNDLDFKSNTMTSSD